MWLVGDIGGTKTLLACYSDACCDHIAFEKTYHSQSYPDFSMLLDDFLIDVVDQDLGLDRLFERACFALAGPVIAASCRLTNLPWFVDATLLQKQLGCPVYLINDLEAIATAIVAPGRASTLPVVTLQAGDLGRMGSSGSMATKAVIAPGTGLGMGYAVWDTGRARYRACASEGGHIDFAPRTALQMELLTYMKKSVRSISLEQICSGLGIAEVFKFLENRQGASCFDSDQSHIRYTVPEIIEAAYLNSHPSALFLRCAKETVELFLQLLGQATQSLALMTLSIGGIYLTGGISRHLQESWLKTIYMEYFLEHSTMGDVLRTIPLYWVSDPKIGLYGAYAFLVGLFLQEQAVI